MSKKDFLVEYITSDIISYIVTDKKIPMLDAMKEFYGSETFSKLNDFETGLYAESSQYVYDIYNLEKKNGKIIQNEI